MNSPMMPKAIRPPMTPAKISSRGRLALRRMRIGRIKPSMLMTKIDQIAKAIPQPVLPFQNSQKTTGIRIGPAPIWAMVSMKMTAVNSDA